MAGGEFAARGRVAVREFFEQANRAEREAVGEMFLIALTEDKFCAAAADIKQEQWSLRQFRVGRHASKRPFGLLIARNDFDFQPAGFFDGGSQLIGVQRIARCAGGDDADGGGVVVARNLGEFRHGLGGAGDGFGLQTVRFVKTFAETCLAAVLAKGPHVASHTSATSSLTELVPTSMTARRVVSMRRQGYEADLPEPK